MPAAELRARIRRRCWARVFLDTAAQVVAANNHRDPVAMRAAVPRLIAAGVRFLAGLNLADDPPEQLPLRLSQVDLVLTALAALTPAQVARLFPDDKRFDGARWGCVDHFSTVELLNDLGLNEQLGTRERVLTLLMSFDSTLLRRFAVNTLTVANRATDGGVVDQLFAALDATPVDVHRAKLGRTRPRRPRWLRVVDGGKEVG